MLMDWAKKAFEIGSKFVGGFAEPLGMLMGRQAFGITPHRGDSAIAEALSNNSEALKGLADAQAGLVAVQERRNQLTQIGLVTNAIVAGENLAIARAKLAQDARFKEAELALMGESVELTRKKLAQDAELARLEREQKAHLSKLWRDLQRELQVNELQHRETLQARQIQADWDKIKLPTIFSRQELENLAQDIEHPLFVCAKMQITAGCPDYFKTELAADAESQIKKFANSVFQERVRFYSRFFDDENIFDTNAAQLQSIIPNVPCVMSFSKVTRRCAYFHYKLWGSQSAKLLGGHLDVELPWRELAQQVQGEVGAVGASLAEDDLYEMIGDWLTTLQKIYAVFLLDLYALVDGDNPFYVTQLEGVNVGLPAGLETEYIRPLALFLHRIQQERITAFNEALRQQQGAAERERQRREAEARRQREAEERRRREEAERRRALIFKLPNDGGDLEFVWVPAGTLNLNGRVITLAAFRMSKYPITQRQYQAIMGRNPSYFKDDLDHPIENVYWKDAVDFCQNLSQEPVMLGQTVRLPSETQWEYACRAGTATAFWFGDSDSELGNYAWYSGNSGSRTHSVYEKATDQANPWGLVDMHGNVWEWCADNWAGNTNELPADGTPLNNGGDYSKKVLRGGSWVSYPRDCRSAARSVRGVDDRLYSGGFRVVLVV